MDKRFLIIARVGDDSLHPNWLQDDQPNFDLFLSYFGDEADRYKEQATFYEQQKGGKWPKIGELIDQYWELINTYDAVWFPDESVLANAKTINRLFALFDGHQLSLAQPAFSLDSFFSQAVLLRKKACHLRYVNFVDVTAPIMSQAALKKTKATFSESPSGWGLNRLWSSLLPNKMRDKIAIIDDTPVTITRPAASQPYTTTLNQTRKLRLTERTQSNNPRGTQNFQDPFRVYGYLVKAGSNGSASAILRAKWQQTCLNLRAKFSKRYQL